MDCYQGSTLPNFIPFGLGEQNAETPTTPNNLQTSASSAVNLRSDELTSTGQSQKSAGSAYSEAAVNQFADDMVVLMEKAQASAAKSSDELAAE